MTKQTGSYTIEAEKELIRVAIIGTLTAEQITACYEEAQVIMSQKHGPRDFLVNIEKAGMASKSAIKVSIKHFREGPYRRVAIYGVTKPGVMLIVTNMLKVSGSNDKLKIFRSEKLAREWLKESSHPVRAKIERLRPHTKEDDTSVL